MLWMKSWLETRWRLLYGLVIPLIALSLPYLMRPAGSRPIADWRPALGVLGFFALFNAAYLAGAGIKTQSPFAAKKGVHGSLYYTLSLPVSRLRLLSVRAAAGFFEFAIASATMYSGFWLLSPAVRSSVTPLDLFANILAATVSLACFYFVSVLLAIFLDDPWQTFGAIFLAMLTWSLVTRFTPPDRYNIFGFAGPASPLISHTLPWPAMTISLVVSAILFLSAWQIAERREY